jgi:hypothetical protein
VTKSPTAVVLALGLLLPAALLGAALWLTESGTLERLRAEEKARAERELDAFAGRFAARLQALAATPGRERVAITLDDRGRPTEPFTPWPVATATSDGAAELELDVARALAARGELAAARERLLRARGLPGPPACAPLAFELVCRLLEASLCADAGDPGCARQLLAAVLAGEVAMPAAAARPVVAFLHSLVPPGWDASAEHAWFGAAGLVALLEEHHVDPPARTTLAPNGALVVPVARRLVVLAGALCLTELDAALHDAAAAGGSVLLATAPSARTVASAPLAPLPFTVHAEFAEPQASEKLA